MSSASPVLTFAIRGTQALFAIIVFGLSTSLVKGHHFGSLPSTLSFVAFAGGLSFVGALLGIAGHWVQVLQGQIGLLLDAAIAGINIAGGILMAIKVKNIQCKSFPLQDHYNPTSNEWTMITNDIICGGQKEENDGTFCYWLNKNTLGMLTSRCKMSQADSAFMFLTAIVVVVAAVLGFLRMKRGY